MPRIIHNVIRTYMSLCTFVYLCAYYILPIAHCTLHFAYCTLHFAYQLRCPGQRSWRFCSELAMEVLPALPAYWPWTSRLEQFMRRGHGIELIGYEINLLNKV